MTEKSYPRLEDGVVVYEPPRPKAQQEPKREEKAARPRKTSGAKE